MQINSPGLEKEAIQICGGSSGIWKTYRNRIQWFMTKRRGVLRKRQAASSGAGLPGKAVADQDVSEAGSPVPIRERCRKVMLLSSVTKRVRTWRCLQ